MYKTIVIFSCLVALCLATPLPEQQKKTDKRSVGVVVPETHAEVSYQNVPVVRNVQVPVTRHVSVPVTSNVNVPVVNNVQVPVVNYKTHYTYHAPLVYSSYVVPSSYYSYSL
ncbi:uncharacterized protein LOC115889977 [Sitophilus oryzae]|uniref:Uncharacterized protein LOC115889977 n=1 Tax=Sitophilus oryzae TaxID=7048 RepID=A0A6J2YRM2_SITOR|nr:uncharacterized protein LOC115889977 [Sitophilus oryzae]